MNFIYNDYNICLLGYTTSTSLASLSDDIVLSFISSSCVDIGCGMSVVRGGNSRASSGDCDRGLEYLCAESTVLWVESTVLWEVFVSTGWVLASCLLSCQIEM